MARWPLTAEQRFWSMVNKTDSCWLWTGRPGRKGYGCLWVDGRSWLSHRYSLVLHGVDLKDEDCALHKCDVRLCVNPDHLFLGTRADNTADMIAKGRASFYHNAFPGGSANPVARLTEQDVLEIRRLHREEGLTHRALADRFGVARSNITLIVNGKTWAHVGGL